MCDVVALERRFSNRRIVNPPAYTWAWAASESGGAAVQIGGGPWNLEPEGAAFALSTDVPEAPSAVCLLIGIVGLWAFGKAGEHGRFATQRVGLTD